MEVPFIRDAINATLALFEKYGFGSEPGAEELRKLQTFNLEFPKSAFGARWRLANSASFLAGRVQEPLRRALLSTAHLGYQHCATGNDDFRKSRDEARAALQPSGPLAELDILDVFESALTPLQVPGAELSTQLRSVAEEPVGACQRI